VTDRTSGIDRTFEQDDLSDTRLPEAILKTDAYKTPTPTSELLGGDARDVRAESVVLEGSGAETITADRVSVTNSGTRSIDAKSVQVERSGVLALHGQNVVLQDSSAVSVTADEVRMVKGMALYVRAGKVVLDGDSRALVMDGEDVRPVVSVQGAAAFGAAVAVVLMLLGRLFGGHGKQTGRE
jgi:hypothetical protein